MLYHKGISRTIKVKINAMNAIVFFKAVIKNGEIDLLADLNTITAKLQNIAAVKAALSPKYSKLTTEL